MSTAILRDIQRNFNVRLAALGHTKSSLAEELGVSSQIIHKKLAGCHEKPHWLTWLAMIVVCPPSALADELPGRAGSYPLPGSGWEEKIAAFCERRETVDHDDLLEELKMLSVENANG